MMLILIFCLYKAKTNDVKIDCKNKEIYLSKHFINEVIFENKIKILNSKTIDICGKNKDTFILKDQILNIKIGKFSLKDSLKIG